MPFCHPRHQVRNFSLETGPHVRSGPHLPFQNEARARQSCGGLVWKSSDSVVRTVAGWALGSELTDTSCKQSGSEESGPWDRATETLGGGTPPGPAFGDDGESKGGPERQARLSGEMGAQSADHQMDFRKTSGPHKDAPPAQPSCEAGALGDSPHLRQTSPPERRLLPRRDGIHRMAVGQSLQARALEGSPPCVESGGRPSGAPRRPTRTPAPARHPTPAASAGKPSVGARTWPSTGWCTRGRSPTRARSAARPSAGSPT